MMIKVPRGFPKNRPPTIYKCPQRIEPLGSTMCPPQSDRTHRLGWPDAASASARCTPSPQMGAMCPHLNTARWSSTVVKLISAQSKSWPDASEEMTGRGQPRVWSSPVRVSRAKKVPDVSGHTWPDAPSVRSDHRHLRVTSQHWSDADISVRSASGHSVTSIQSQREHWSFKYFRDFATFSTLAQMC
jgi:hypothetical protein